MSYGRYLPIALRLDGREVVVIGGDGEAEAKVEKLLRCDARITVVAPEATEEIERQAAAGRLRRVRRAYRQGDLAGAAVAIVCEPRAALPAHAECRRRGVLLNVLDRPELCDFSAVAYFERDGLQIGVHSSGKSAALARRIRERLERSHGRAFGELVRALGELREEVRGIIASAAERRSFWLGVVDEPLLDEIETGLFEPEQFKAKTLAAARRAGNENHRGTERWQSR